MYSSDEITAIEYARSVLSEDRVPGQREVVEMSARVDEISNAAMSVARRVNEGLATLDPNRFREHLDPREGDFEIPDRSGLGVVAWMGVAMGGGADKSRRAAELVIDGYTKWLLLESAARLARRSVPEEIVPDSVTHGEWVRRLYSTQTRFSAISQLLFEGCVRGSVGVELSEKSPRTRRIRRMAESLFRELRSYFFSQGKYYSPRSAISGRRIAGGPTPEAVAVRKFCELASMKAGELAGKNFVDVVGGREPEVRPFIDCSEEGEGRYWPANLDALIFRPEVAAFEAIRLGGGDRGAVFEQAVRYAVNDLLPDDLWVHPSALRVSPKVGGDDLETDLAIFGSEGLIILGDDKCAIPTNRPSSNSMSSDDLGKGVVQVRKRIEALSAGRQLVDGASSRKVGGGDGCWGLVVTLHGHGGKLWSRDAIRMVGGEPDIALMPAHSLALVSSLVDSRQELESYLRHRSDVIGRGLEFTDEHEILLSFFSGSTRVPVTPEERSERLFGALVKPYTVDFIDSVGLEKLPSRRTRKAWFWGASVPVR